MHVGQKVNWAGPNMPDDVLYPPPQEGPNPDEVDVLGWLRWWHWLILIGLFLAAFMYYPLWRFEQGWKQLQVGDSLDRMKELLGDPGKASYTVQGAGPSGNDDAYVYSRYWKSYEVLVSGSSKRVTAMTEVGGKSAQAPPLNAPTKQ